MKTFILPQGLCAGARAMQRISRALARYAPPHITTVGCVEDADLVVLYTISADAIQYGLDLVAGGKRIAVVQCCLKTAGGAIEDWIELWCKASLVWSYYRLDLEILDSGFDFYFAPLGLDGAFIQPFTDDQPRNLVLTSGYVHGRGAEAILEAWEAVNRYNTILSPSLVGLHPVHIGPKLIEGIAPDRYPSDWTNMEGVTDEQLAQMYRRAAFVCSLRHVEGFELPLAEGTACGARGVAFDQPTLRQWYGVLTDYVPECSGELLVDCLVRVFKDSCLPGKWEVEQAHKRFNWERIATGFWDRVDI